MARMNATLVFAIMRVAVLNMLPNLVMKSDSKKLGSNLILGRLRATIFGYINIIVFLQPMTNPVIDLAPMHLLTNKDCRCFLHGTVRIISNNIK